MPQSRSSSRFPIRIVLADDHQAVRERLVTQLIEEADLEVVAEAGDGGEAFELVVREMPDVVLMDVQMPEVNGIEATRRIKGAYPGITVIGFSVNDNETTARAMMEAGAAYFMSKACPSEDLIEAIRKAAARSRLQTFPPETSA